MYNLIVTFFTLDILSQTPESGSGLIKTFCICCIEISFQSFVCLHHVPQLSNMPVSFDATLEQQPQIMQHPAISVNYTSACVMRLALWS